MNIDGTRLSSLRLTGKQVLWAIGIGSLLIVLAAFIFLAYFFGWEWTGFPGKSLFDWLEILVNASIPIAVAIGTFALNRAAKRRDDEAERSRRAWEERIQQELNAQRAEEASLRAYLDYMWRMLSGPNQPLGPRVRTLQMLGSVQSPERKRIVLQFLYEAGLITKNHPVISLQRADLQGVDLSRADLSIADLRGANLEDAEGLTQDQIEKAIGDEKTALPKGIKPPKSWSARPTSTRKRDN